MRGIAGGTNGPPPTFAALATPGSIGSGFHFHRSNALADSLSGDAARPGIAEVILVIQRTLSEPQMLFIFLY